MVTKKRIIFQSYLLRNNMTRQATPRGHHAGPRRDKVLGTEPELGALFSFQCQAKTMKGTKILTSMMVNEGHWALGLTGVLYEECPRPEE
jgi:hypothetical protein